MSDWLTLKETLRLTLRPIDSWPGKLRTSYQRESGPYSAPLKDTLGILKRELGAMRATEIVLQIAIPERHLRLDGLPRAGATAEHPGVILCFKTPQGHRRRAFDRFTKWEHNLRALACNLEHLRLANLYGVEADDQQYRGWAQLPEGFVAVPGDELETAGRYLSNLHPSLTWGSIVTSADAFRTAYRELIREVHPDTGGDHETFLRFEAAAKVLRKHHGETNA